MMSKADKIEAVFSGAEEVLVGVREKIGKSLMISIMRVSMSEKLQNF